MFALLAIVVTAPIPKAEPARPTLVGTWRLEAEVRGGVAIKVSPNSFVEFTATGRQLARAGPTDDDIWTYRIEPDSTLDLFPPRDHEVPGLRAIYRLDGDTLYLCQSPTDRPSTFESPARSAVSLLTYTRVKPN